MKYWTYFFTCTLFCSFGLFAQMTDCDCTNRYETEIFSEVDVQTVTYSDPHGLQMDIYTPVGDVCTNRPLLILAHGGTFIFGSKSNPTMVDLCETFAKRGYVTASINYRLAADIVGLFAQFTYYTDTQSAYEVVLNAVMDGKAAVRYFRKDVIENGNTYGIDQDQIWGGGNSAGGVLFLHAAHVSSLEEFTSPLTDAKALIAENIIESLGGIEGNSGNEGYSSSLSGVISLAGGLHRSEYINTGDVPSVFCHGDDDSVLPYDCNGFQNNPNYDQLCGGGALSPVCNISDVTNSLLTFENDDHCPWDSSSEKMQQVKMFVGDFLYENINCEPLSIQETELSQDVIYKTDILGRKISSNKMGLIFSIYSDGRVDKKYILKIK